MPDQLGITIEFMGKTLKFDKTVSNMEKSINILKKGVASLNRDLKLDPTNISKVSEKFKNLKIQEKLARDILNKFLEDMEQLNKDNVSPFNEKFTATQKEIDKASKRLNDIQKQIKKITDGFGETNEEVITFSERLSNAGEKAEALGNALAPISNAARNYLGDAINGAIEFESAFADVEKTVNATPEEFAQIRTELRELATQLPTTASELSHIAGLAGQMGVKAEDIAEFTRAMVDFGNATDITAEEATKDIAQIYNVIGKGDDFSSLDNLLSTIVELGNNTATTESAIVEMFRNVAAASSRVGMNEQQMAALAATLSSLGLDKGGASAISKIMTNIDKAVDSGGKSLAEWAEVAGMASSKFKELWNQDAANGLLAVVEGIAKSNEAGTSFNQTLEDLGIKEIRQVDTLSRLVNANQNYADNLDMANRAFAEGTALSEEAEKRYATVASQIDILKNNFMEFALTIGDLMLPYVRFFIESLRTLTDWLNNLQPHTKLLITRILAIVAALSPLILGASKILKFGSNIKGNINLLIQGLSNLQKSLVSLWNFLLPVMQTVFMWLAQHAVVIGIVFALGVAIKTLYDNCQPFREWVDGMIKKMKELWEQFKQTNWIEYLGEKFGWLGEIIGALIELVKTLVTWFGTLISKALEFLGIKSSVESAATGLGRGRNQITVLDSGGFGALMSGGFASGGLTVNPVFNVTTNAITRDEVHSWASWIADDINEELGRRIR